MPALKRANRQLLCQFEAQQHDRWSLRCEEAPRVRQECLTTSHLGWAWLTTGPHMASSIRSSKMPRRRSPATVVRLPFERLLVRAGVVQLMQSSVVGKVLLRGLGCLALPHSRLAITLSSQYVSVTDQCPSLTLSPVRGDGDGLSVLRAPVYGGGSSICRQPQSLCRRIASPLECVHHALHSSTAVFRRHSWPCRCGLTLLLE